MVSPSYENTGVIVESIEPKPKTDFYEPTENDKELTSFVVDHADRWRDYRDQNYMDDWERYERVFRGKWNAEDKHRDSERSKIISPATQQAVETRHAEIMEAVFGQGEYFDIKDDIKDVNGSAVDVEQLKNQLKEDFAQDKIRKSIEQISLMAEIYGTGIGEVTVSKSKYYYPATIPLDQTQAAYGVSEKDRICVKINPINPKNFLFDPNGTSIDDCMGVAIERHVSIHKISAGITSGKYKKADIGSFYKDDSFEPTQETHHFQDEKVLLLTYYGLVPREYLAKKHSDDDPEINEETEDYEDMVEAIIVIANDNILLKAEESPYMMKDRPIICYQADTVPNRLLGRGTIEKAYNMQCAIDGSMRSHMDSLALTTAPMIGMDATRLPRGAKFEIKPGKSFMTNGNPAEILFPFKFGATDGQSMETSKEFERMLLMATATIDSNGTVSQVSRDGSMDMATATMIKKYKRTLVNFQEDFLIPFINKAAWRYMQFDPERYPSVDVKFLPTATLGIIAREHEQKQLAFMIQTLGAQSPLTPILMQGILKNSSLSEREKMIEQMAKMSQPDPQAQQMQQQQAQMQIAMLQAQIQETQAKAQAQQANAQKTVVETQLAPEETKARVVAALSTNLNEDAEQKDFEKRVRLADLMLKEEDVRSNERIAFAQMQRKGNA
ncbi:MAG: hypothetical protein UW55_C0024G0007 [Candidatus Giovannonibacteria bacterium GW2011_GWA2_44_26]|uniref:Portal protein n=1 Tax=Candidatus Giovannonibacteria bacterium GW2011_GWA2_44_26 TaxID=1618648 RepID=A0A0G1IRK1_9BACT|nr:MAG: hypothetical protein UW55_C0024G0007 [Candidatus Giovannonibacteria bacterium GW2011_GWA2_44_26]